MSGLPWAVYLHVPFCVRRCHYCDFATAALSLHPAERTARVQRWHQAVQAELASSPPRPASSVFFGGGTPTTVPAAVLTGLLDQIRDHGGLLPDAEVTIEANPTTAEADLFGTLRAAGFNRLSLGVQSFDDRLLQALGRTHDVAQAVRAVDLARAAGFDNYSLDLMFALPGQSLADWQRALQRAVDLGPPHLSLYGLAVEAGTPLEQLVASGRVQLLDEDLAADMYEWALDWLPAQGWEAYEIASFARPGRRGQHNQVYWRNEEYRGFGPGAASYVARRRWTNLAASEAYAAAVLNGGDPVAEHEQRSLAEEQRETVYLGLRMRDGLEVARFEQRFGSPLDATFAAEWQRLQAKGWVERTPTHWRLTRQGVLLSNQVFLEFV
ncbi:MAG: radical SAM family heme chaperone HemW [Fimbriimonadaceae bacterium]|nr:radical SAM family heme chaperone HemW [Fimbriimonadaceae bacterium]